jgi:hypothetical protein
MTSLRMLRTIALLGSGAFAQSIVLPSGLTVQANNPSGTGFTYSGTLTQAATISLTVTGAACEQAGNVYCTNGAGVLTVAGTSPVGAATTFSGNFGGTTGTWDFGAVIMTISGVGAVQIFPASVGNGLGSPAPPNSLTLPATSLSALGFSSFSVSNPTITFIVADYAYGDNSQGFTISQGGVPTTPVPGTFWLVILGVAALMLAFWFRPAFSRSI